jgi:signal transduction histidine kinase
MENIEKAFETNRIQQFEYSVPKGDSEELFEARIVVFSKDKVMGIVREVTEEKRLLAELHQSQKMEALGLLAGGVAHDFNNALTVISFSAGVLRKRLKDDEKLAKRVSAISESTQHAAALTSQLLAFSRKQDNRPQVVELNSIVERTQKMLRRLLGEDIKVRLKLEEDLWKVKIDPNQVGQILMNLATNARDAMSEGGTIHIETRNFSAGSQADSGTGEVVRLVVKDTGCGMDEDTLERVFEPFFTTKEIGKGTGLGLSTVFGIVKQAGGEIHIESQPGKGTLFEIDFPRFGDEEEQAPVESGLSAPLEEKGSGTILVVEDEDQIRAVFCEALQSVGYDVLEAPNGVSALQLARDHEGRIDLLLTDVVMPEMNGSVLAKELLSLRPDLKVLYTTGYPDEVVRRHGVDPKQVPLLQKPFDKPVLGSRIRDVIEART